MPGGNPAKLVPFKKGDPKINRNGRPPKTVGSVLKELKEKGFVAVTKHQVVETYLTLVAVNNDALRDIIADDHSPVLNKIVAKRLLNKDGFEIIEKMLDRAIGKAEQKTDLTSNGQTLPAIVNILPPEVPTTSQPQE